MTTKNPVGRPRLKDSTSAIWLRVPASILKYYEAEVERRGEKNIRRVIVAALAERAKAGSNEEIAA